MSGIIISSYTFGGGGIPSSWTFTSSSQYVGSATYTGELGTQSFGVGGLADGANTGTTSVAATNNEVSSFIRADLGSVVTCTRVYLRCIAGAFEGWGVPYTFGINHKLQYSDNGSSWTTAVAFDGTISSEAVQTFTVNQLARYWRLSTDGASGYSSAGDFYFD